MSACLSVTQQEGLRRVRAHAENNKLSLALLRTLAAQPQGTVDPFY
jgi:hypothetical protein